MFRRSLRSLRQGDAHRFALRQRAWLRLNRMAFHAILRETGIVGPEIPMP